MKPIHFTLKVGDRVHHRKLIGDPRAPGRRRIRNLYGTLRAVDLTEPRDDGNYRAAVAYDNGELDENVALVELAPEGGRPS